MPDYSFRKYQALSLRIWHWANAAAVFGLLATVLIRKTFLSWHTNSAVIEEKLRAAGASITPELAKEIAVAIRAPLWDWHVYLGLTLATLLIARILIAVLVEKRCPGMHALKCALGISKVPAEERHSAIHFTAVRLGYAAFYLVTIVMVLTGLLLNFKAGIGLPKELAGTTKEIHEFLMWFFVVFAGGHIVGVVVAENRGNQGIVSDMIHGGNKGTQDRLP